MPSSAGSFGLKPIESLSGAVTMVVNEYPIASNYGTSIFYGDVVKVHTDGTLLKDTGTTSLTPIGIFQGCRFTHPTTKKPTFSMYYPASTVASDIVALVVDDPNIEFEVQCSAAVTQTSVQGNAAVVQGSGSTTFGKSGVTLDASTIANTNTLPLKILRIPERPGENSASDTYPIVICKFNVGHQTANTTGVA